MHSKSTYSGNSIPVNIPFIDSLSLKLPLNDVTVIDTRLTSETLVVYTDTGEVETRINDFGQIDDIVHPPKPIIIEKKGVKIRLSIVNINLFDTVLNEKVPTKFINITLSSKMLKERYFEGINRNNIEYFYNEFMDFKVFKCSFRTFKKGIVSDVDVAINRYCSSLTAFSGALDALYLQSGTRSKYLRLFGKTENQKKEGNIGLSFSDRNSARPSTPFIKFYHKQMELLHKSSEFNENYLYNYQCEIVGLTRVEATVKNHKHKRRLAKYDVLPMFRTLDDLLDINSQDLYNFVIFSLNAYITPRLRLKAPDLTPTDHIIFELLQNCVINGYDYDSLLSIADTFKASSKSAEGPTKSRIRKKITTLFDLLVHKDLKLLKKSKMNKDISEYLSYFKIQSKK